MEHEDGRDGDGGAWATVTALYEAHALSLARLALVMVGDPAAAEDVMQDAFLGLYRRWDKLAGPEVAVTYLRTSVLNGCRSARKRQARRGVPAGALDGEQEAAFIAGGHEPGRDVFRGVPRALAARTLESAEATVLLAEEHRAVLAAVRRLPARQREALVLRYYLDMTEEQAAQAMRISRGTVKSATSRALAAVGRMLREGS